MTVTIRHRPAAAQRFPFIPLPRALERANELYKAANAHEVPFPMAAGTWGYGEKSSGGAQTAAALKAFGLLQDVGEGDVRKVKLTEVALRIIRDPRDPSPERDALIRQAASRPPLHKEVLDKYGGPPPSEQALKAYLLLERGMKEEAVPDFIREFKVTMAFAGGSTSANAQDMETESEDAARALAFTDGFARVRAGVPGGIQGRLRELARTLPPGETRQQQPLPGGALAPDPPGMRREVFALDEGDVTLTFPENLSADSYEDLEAYIELFLRKAKRRAAVQNSTPD